MTFSQDMDNSHKCKYCGEQASYYLPSGKAWCCSSSHNKCPANKNKNRSKHIGKPRPEWIADMLREFGKNRVISDITREKLRVAGYKRKHTEEEKLKIGRANKGKLVGRKKSDEFKRKISELVKMDKNPNWKGGVSFLPYPKEFNNNLKEAIKRRDNYKCRNPNCSFDSNVLTIHHIDYDKNNCSDVNLISLCNKCHSRTNGNREVNMRKYMLIMVEIYNGIQ